MKKVYPRAHEALLAVSRHDFVSGSDLIPSITGHSIPREETVSHILSIMPEITPADDVIHVGGGSGYLAAVLSNLAHRVIYIEKNPDVADAAKARVFRLGMHNVDVLAQPAESGFGLDQPCDLVLCNTFTGFIPVIPVAQGNRKVTFVTDDPDARTDQAVLSGVGGKRDKPLGKEVGGDNVSPYLVSVYEAILLDAVSEKASDIHGERVRIRLRVHVAHDRLPLPAPA